MYTARISDMDEQVPANQNIAFRGPKCRIVSLLHAISLVTVEIG